MRQNKKDEIKVVGITGGVGSGKSEVMSLLHDKYGVAVILADLVAHDLMEPGGASYEAIVKAFGEEILAADAAIDRKRLSGLVFGDAEKLKTLNAITHPNVRREIFRRIAEIKEASTASFIAVEAALLLEEGYQESFDAMWYVYVEPEIRIARLMAGRGYTRQKCIDIMNHQLSEETFRAACSVVIDNSDTLFKTERQVEKAVKELLSLYE